MKTMTVCMSARSARQPNRIQNSLWFTSIRSFCGFVRFCPYKMHRIEENAKAKRTNNKKIMLSTQCFSSIRIHSAPLNFALVHAAHCVNVSERPLYPNALIRSLVSFTQIQNIHTLHSLHRHNYLFFNFWLSFHFGKRFLFAAYRIHSDLENGKANQRQ